MKKKILSVLGTRPEAIKMAPLILEIAKHPDCFDNIVCVTAQHREMLDQVLDIFNIIPDYDLNIMQPKQTLSGVMGEILSGLDSVIAKSRPDIILVHGDTITSFAAALSAFFHQIPVGHVEAGLRSGNKLSPFPEEMARTLTGSIADLHFAPTKLNAENLYKSGITKNVYITGNTVIDALLSIVRDGYSFKNNDLCGIDFQTKKTILITIHRRENLGEPMKNILTAIKRLALKYENDIRFIYPVHKNPVVAECAAKILGGLGNVYLIGPLDVEDMHNLINISYFVITDSGGLQEEAPALGKPVLVCRTETERPEAVDAGTVKIVWADEENIYNEAVSLLENTDEYKRMSRAVNPYGDGRASKRIVEILAAADQAKYVYIPKENPFLEIIADINRDIDAKIEDAQNFGKLRDKEMHRQFSLYEAEIQKKDIVIDELRRNNAALISTHQDTLSSKKFRLAHMIALTAKNPLKIFLWPMWIFKLLTR